MRCKVTSFPTIKVPRDLYPIPMLPPTQHSFSPILPAIYMLIGFEVQIDFI